jgi:hypothetical protein
LTSLIDVERVSIVDVERDQARHGARSVAERLHLEFAFGAGDPELGPAGGNHPCEVRLLPVDLLHVPGIAAVCAEERGRRDHRDRGEPEARHA